jgi:hypothetical protein
MMEEYERHLDNSKVGFIRAAKVSGFFFGFAQFCISLVFACVLFANVWLMREYPLAMNPKDNGIAFMVLIFGIMSAANVASMAPDAAIGKMSGIKIFSIIETPSLINAVDEDP